MDLSHGGDWAGFQAKYGTLPLDFSASTTPLPMPAGMREAVVRSLDRADRYPDPLCRELTAALGERHGLPPAHILCGAGAADLLFRLALVRRPRRALIAEPAFAGYEESLTAAGCQAERYFLREENGYALTADILTRIKPGLDVLFLCSPNNPTGRTVDRGLLLEIVERCAGNGTLLVLDECFNDFLDCPDKHTLTGEVEACPNLLILRSFTKWYPMAGLRLGYALCSDGPLLDKMRRTGQPWPVSGVAQTAGLEALEEKAYSAQLSDLIREQRPALAAGLAALGCETVPGEANFLLFRCPDLELDQKLEKRGILIRNCSRFPGLGAGWYRTAVRTGRENEALLRAIRNCLKITCYFQTVPQGPGDSRDGANAP